MLVRLVQLRTVQAEQLAGDPEGAGHLIHDAAGRADHLVFDGLTEDGQIEPG